MAEKDSREEDTEDGQIWYGVEELVGDRIDCGGSKTFFDIL